jgi:hypothetical protein
MPEVRSIHSTFVPFTAIGGCYNGSRMSFAIRPLLKRKSGECRLCQSHAELHFWDSDLAGRVCEDCEPFLGAAEKALVAADFWHPSESLVFRNP